MAERVSFSRGDQSRSPNLYLTMKMLAVGSSEMSASIYSTTQSNVPEDFGLQEHRCDNLKSPILYCLAESENSLSCESCE